MKSFESLTEKEILALAISQEEEDARIYDDFADGLRENDPEQAEKFVRLRRKEDSHRHRLLELFRQRFGETRAVVAASELLGDLAEEERHHAVTAAEIGAAKLSQEESSPKAPFVLQVIQPGLAGLMDGPVSTLAPLFAAAFATHNSIDTFRVGLAASLAQASARVLRKRFRTMAASPVEAIHGAAACGLMTAINGFGHTLPYLIADVHTATWIAVAIVLLELAVISWVRHRFMDTPWSSAAVQVVLGGLLVFAVGILIGSS